MANLDAVRDGQFVIYPNDATEKSTSTSSASDGRRRMHSIGASAAKYSLAGDATAATVVWPPSISYERAIPLIQKASTMYAPPFVTAYLAFAQGMAGHRDAALKQIAALEKMSPGGKVLPFNLWQDAMFDSLRSEPRFTALLRKLNFVR